MHVHDHIHHEQTKALRIAMWIAVVFMIVEVVGGLIAHSLALLSDALHMFMDVGAIFLSLITMKIARRPSTPIMSYGYQRAEILGALASALSLWVLCLILIYEAIKRLIYPPEVEGGIVFIIAVVGLIGNLVMMRVLHGSHSHSLNVKAAYLHVISDLLGSVAVIISGLIVWLTHWNYADPLISVLFACSILFSSGKIIRETLTILMESAPPGFDPQKIQKDLERIEGVQEVHDLHIWTVSTHHHALSVHIIATDTQKVLNAVHDLLEKNYKIKHMTVQVEDPASFQRKYCYDTDHSDSSPVES